MPAPTTIDDFLAVVRKSNQVDANRLNAYLAEDRESPLPAEPRKLAQQLVRAGVMSVFQAEQFLQGKYKGFHLGGYRILDRLGIGGTGTVYLAEHEVMKRRVALKILPTPLAEDREQLERFRLEARAAAVLDHPNVVHVYDFRQEGSLYFIVMEFVDGPNLHQLVSRAGPLPIPLACEYVRQAALGLQHAHEAGLVHRDIKPANLLVDPQGIVKVLDMGLARFDPEGGNSVTERFNNRMVLGTADYLAPEQALNLHQVDARADIYSLGATLYTLLTGRPPFHEGSIGQKLMWHQMKTPDSVTAHRPEVPPELAALVDKMLAKDPAHRIQTAAEVAEVLLPFAENQPRPEFGTGGSGVNLLRTTGRTVTLGGTSRRLYPNSPSQETRAHAQDDTASIELQDPKRIRQPVKVEQMDELTLSHEGIWLRLGILMGLIALVAGLVGGVLAFLIWGPRVG